MNKRPGIFISYNPGSDFEETLALRLHTIGAVSGIDMYLPDRNYGREKMTLETSNRINVCDYYILFSTKSPLSKIALEEIGFAFQRHQDKKRIIIIYDAMQGKNLAGTENCTELFFNRRGETFDQFAAKVVQSISDHSAEQNKRNNELVGGLILTGSGLLVLGSLTSKN